MNEHTVKASMDAVHIDRSTRHCHVDISDLGVAFSEIVANGIPSVITLETPFTDVVFRYVRNEETEDEVKAFIYISLAPNGSVWTLACAND